MGFNFQANFCSNMEERVSGALLTSTISCNHGELFGLDLVRNAHGAPPQHPGGDHQRLRYRHRAHLHNPLLHLLRQEKEGHSFAGFAG